MKSIFQILSVIIIILFFSNNTLAIHFKFNSFPKDKNIPAERDSVYKFYKDKLDVYKYPVKERLPLIQIPDYDSTQTTKKEKVNIKVLLPKRIRYANIYLFINKEKIDLYYAVNEGEYTFRNVRLRTGRNNIEVFYTLGNSRSNSTSIIIDKE